MRAASLPTVQRPRAFFLPTHLPKETVMRYFLLIALLAGMFTTSIGCDARGKVDEDGAKVKVDTK